MDLDIIFGVFGLLVILLAYTLNNLGKFKKNIKSYYLSNLIGSFFLAYYSFSINSIPFLILQLFWILSSGYSYLTYCLKK